MRLSSLRPAYFVRRVRQMRFDRANPDAPWLGESAVLMLECWLRRTDVGIEWGSGRSTAWLGSRVRHITSIEDDPRWHQRVARMIGEKGLAASVDLRLSPCELTEQDEPRTHAYSDVALEFADGSLDFALVDGNIRLTCMKTVMPKLRPGGLLILDNANRYVPNRFQGRHTTVHEPRSEPRTPNWRTLLDELSGWRSINTSDGIWDTRFWVAP